MYFIILYFIKSILILIFLLFSLAGQIQMIADIGLDTEDGVTFSIIFSIVFIIIDLILIVLIKAMFFRKRGEMEKLRMQKNKLLNEKEKQRREHEKQRQKNEKKAEKEQINKYSNAILEYSGYANPINVEYNLRIVESYKHIEIFFKEECVYYCEFIECIQQKTEGYDVPDTIRRTNDGYEIEKGFEVPRTYHTVKTEKVIIYSNEEEWVKLLKKWKKEAEKLHYKNEIEKLKKEIKEIKN